MITSTKIEDFSRRECVPHERRTLTVETLNVEPPRTSASYTLDTSLSDITLLGSVGPSPLQISVSYLHGFLLSSVRFREVPGDGGSDNGVDSAVRGEKSIVRLPIHYEGILGGTGVSLEVHW